MTIAGTSTPDPSMHWRESARAALVAAWAAPAGADPASPPALPVPSDSSQFYPVAGQLRRDLGTVRPSY